MERLVGSIPSIVTALRPTKEVVFEMAAAAWRISAGETLARRTRPIRLEGGRMSVGVEDDSWQRHLGALGPDLVRSINSILGDRTVKSIDFVVDPQLGATGMSFVHPEIRAVAVPPGLAEAAKAIADQTLRDEFLLAAAAYLEKQKER